jgi:AcrR family transcriptional regulator
MTAEPAPRARRPYRSPRREQQAAQTRADVLDAAARLFAEGGWAGTGMREVARAAGVSVETVYANFSSKSDLLISVLDVAIVGDTAPQPLSERPEYAALMSGTRQERITAAARLVTTIHRRTTGVYLALREAAASDEDLDRKLRAGEERRRTNAGEGLTHVVGRALSHEERDGLWAILSVEVYHLLTGLSGWTPEQYQAWLVGVIDRLLDA